MQNLGNAFQKWDKAIPEVSDDFDASFLRIGHLKFSQCHKTSPDLPHGSFFPSALKRMLSELLLKLSFSAIWRGVVCVLWM